MLIRLLPMIANRRVLPLAAIEAVVGRRLAVCGNAQQRAEAVERVEAPVKAEGKFVEIGLKVLRIDAAVVRAFEPSLQVAENQVDDGQVFFGDLRIAALDHRQVGIAARAERIVSRGCIGHDHSAKRNSGFYKPAQGLFSAVRGNLDTQSASVASAAPLRLTVLGLFRANLDGGNNQRLFVGMAPLAFSSRLAADVAFVNLDVIAASDIAADRIAVRPHHSGAQLVQDLKGRFVPCQAKLTLKLNSRNAWSRCGDQIGTPKPCCQGRMAALHNASGFQGNVVAAVPASQNVGPALKSERLARPKYISGSAAVRTRKAIRPFGTFKVASAGCVIGEKLLEIRQRLGK